MGTCVQLFLLSRWAGGIWWCVVYPGTLKILPSLWRYGAISAFESLKISSKWACWLLQCSAVLCRRVCCWKELNYLERDGIGLPKEFWGIYILVKVELYGVLAYGKESFPSGYPRLEQIIAVKEQAWMGLPCARLWCPLPAACSAAANVRVCPVRATLSKGCWAG